MTNIHEVIQPLLAPVFLISACGLLCMAQFNRLTAIVGRIRSLHHERLEIFAHLQDQRNDQRRVMADRFEDVQAQACHLMGRAELVRNTLICLVGGVLLMLAASLMFGLAATATWTGGLAIALFVLGMLAMVLAMIFMLIELSVALTQVRHEHQRIGGLEAQPAESHTPSDPACSSFFK